MIGSPSLSKDLLRAHHFPVVPLATWQLPVQALCSSNKKPRRLLPVGLTRALSLPDQDSLNREHTFAGNRRYFSSCYSSLSEDRAEEERVSDSSGRYDSNSSPEYTSTLKKEERENPAVRSSLRSHNSFLPNTELDEDEDDDYSDEDNLHRYHEDSSFALHGNSKWPLSNGTSNYAISYRDMSCEWGNKGTMLGTESEHWHRSRPNQLNFFPTDSQCFSLSRSGNMIRACEGQCTDRPKGNMSCIHSQHKCTTELLSNNQTEYVSDSSCNSSDGILVNFCTIYNGSNNPATPTTLAVQQFTPLRLQRDLCSLTSSLFPRLQLRSKMASCFVVH